MCHKSALPAVDAGHSHDILFVFQMREIESQINKFVFVLLIISVGQ